MHFVLSLILLLAALLAIALIVGSRLPQNHVSASSIRIRAKAEEIWQILTDFEAYPSWRFGIKRVEVHQTENGLPMWTEVSSKISRIAFKVVEAKAPTWLVTEVADDSLPIRGRWSYRLQEQDGETVLTITETEHIYHPLIRFCLRYLLSYHSAMDVFLTELALKLGQAPQVKHLLPEGEA
ncbi:MAG: SRPBCC family protein [Methylohalobius sp.]|nr:SRPBCC family protein [Methylohalobius sp.]